MSKILPKFLTKELAEKAVRKVWEYVMDEIDSPFAPKRDVGHVTVMVPVMTKRKKKGCPNAHEIIAYTLCEVSFKNKSCKWTADYREIARGKALQLWQDRNDGRTDIVPHLLYQEEHPYWGGVKRDGIVVACSGVEPWFDRMISGMVADMIIAGAYHAWMKSKDKKSEPNKKT